MSNLVSYFIFLKFTKYYFSCIIIASLSYLVLYICNVKNKLMYAIIFNNILLSITEYHPFIVLELNKTPLSSLMVNPKIPLKLITKITPHGPFNFIRSLLAMISWGSSMEHAMSTKKSITNNK